MTSRAAPTISRRAVRVRGQVQGVGFRPFVYRLAQDLALSGRVLNDGGGVQIEVQGSAAQLDAFLARLGSEAPRLARIDAVETTCAEPRVDECGFVIDASAGGPVVTGVTPDAAPCPDCIAEMFDPANRRWRYAFTNCTHCGPRYTITAALPYDRPNTSMAAFAQCPACRREYGDPGDRRFHAQPNACPECGPRLELRDEQGDLMAVDDPVAAALEFLQRGEIVAIKAVGGFQLACDARNAVAVARLRERKAREEKPLAIMVANTASAAALAKVDNAERALLESAQRPIVLLDQLRGGSEPLRGVAPGMTTLGVMLPSSPLHLLLFHEAAGRPAGTAWLASRQPLALVMTSANPGGEPLVIDNDEAVRRLGGIADALLLHDRPVLIRCDDSVVRAAPDGTPAAPAFVRRARGYTPVPIRMPDDGPPVLAVGAYLKNTVCVTRGAEAFLSQHIGSLDNAPTCRALDEAVDHLCEVLEITPEVVVHDLHPDFYSTRYASRVAQEHGLRVVGVQHHHAHVAAVVAEHGVRGPVLGLALDGVGLGSDGSAWGGELLRVDGHRFERLGHLCEIALPGGDRAAREPWRVAAAVLHALGRNDEIGGRFAQPAVHTVQQMLTRDVNCPRTSSMGRWFDAVAGLLGVRSIQAFEGQAPMLLEGLASRHGPVAPITDGYRLAGDVLDLLPLAAHLAGERDAARGAAVFHATLIEALGAWCVEQARAQRLTTIVFGGGCFNNRILADGLRRRLVEHGLDVLEACQAPPNDGGLSLGQAWVGRLAVAAPSLH
ncbi:MAG TPA: carbamoyltransferase HypF [Burkholderiaceae bacterium]|nr:carbamoyltransferase HypF [Burkholderiaceae bacterium]